MPLGKVHSEITEQRVHEEGNTWCERNKEH